MKDCVRFAPMIGSRPGELSPADDKALGQHLQACAACQALAADLAATEGLVSDALLAKANARDFSGFVDGVMARVDPSMLPVLSGGPARARSRRAQGGRTGILAWFRRHRAAATAGLVPVLVAALATIVYLRLAGGPGPAAMLELSSEGEATTILQTVDGPVVLLDGADET